MEVTDRHRENEHFLPKLLDLKRGDAAPYAVSMDMRRPQGVIWTAQHGRKHPPTHGLSQRRPSRGSLWILGRVAGPHRPSYRKRWGILKQQENGLPSGACLCNSKGTSNSSPEKR